MSKKEKAFERGSRKKEFMDEMSKLGILGGKRACPSTPSPSRGLDSENFNNCCYFRTPSRRFTNSAATTVSARILGARLWELHQPHHPFVKICERAVKSCLAREGDGGGEGFEAEYPNLLDQPQQLNHECIPIRPGTASNSRKHVAASRIQYQSVERNGDAIKPMSPVSYYSSMQMAPYNPAVTCSNTLVHKRRMGGSSYSFKASSELLKVVTQILALEEQHASNMDLVKALKKEVDRSHVRIEELLAEKQADRQAMNHFRRLAEGKSSERLHRKQAEELSRMKQSLSDALREVEGEREARTLLERLCDEFAKGIRDYEKDVRIMRHKHDTDHASGKKPVLRISEAWLNERMQIKQKGCPCKISGKETTVVELSLDKETFLQSKTSTVATTIPNLDRDGIKDNCLKRHFLESCPQNEPVSSPQDAADDGDVSCEGTDSSSNEANNNLCVRGSELVEHDDFGSQQDELIKKLAKLNDRQIKATGQSSPASGLWEPKLTSLELNKFKSSLRLLQAVQENSLKAKLLEARRERRWRSIL